MPSVLGAGDIKSVYDWKRLGQKSWRRSWAAQHGQRDFQPNQRTGKAAATMSVSTSFQKLLTRIVPTSAETVRARAHANTIKKRLAASFALKKFLVGGSFVRGTFIHKSSDVDLFAVLSRDEARRGDSYVRSSTLLDNIRADLQARYPTTLVYKDVHAIVVNFATDGCSVDVVPSVFAGWGQHKQPVYWMPDGDGWWMNTSPEAHNAHLKKADARSGGKLKRTAQLLKFWRECRSPKIPISSFHIEMLLAEHRICDGVKSYAQRLTQAFELLADRQCRDLQDPLGIGGYLGACRSKSQRDDALRSVIYSRDHAQAALLAEEARQTKEAKRQWNIVFNGDFPA